MTPLDRDGFTLVELMIVTLIIGLLAMIALPMFDELRDSAYVAVLERNLHGIVKAQELHFAEHEAYTDQLDALDYQPDSDVQITLSVQGTGGGDPATSGWAAHARHRDRSVRCALFTGDAAPPEPAERPGVVACEID